MTAFGRTPDELRSEIKQLEDVERDATEHLVGAFVVDSSPSKRVNCARAERAELENELRVLQSAEELGQGQAAIERRDLEAPSSMQSSVAGSGCPDIKPPKGITPMTQPPTTDHLQAALTEAREQVDAAELQLGAARLDRKGESAAAKELERATDEVQRVEAAITVADRRAAEGEQKAAEDAAQAARVAAYEVAVRRLTKFQEVIASVERLKAEIIEMNAVPRLSKRTDIDHVLRRGMPPACEIIPSRHSVNDVLAELADFQRGDELPGLLARAEEMLAAARDGRQAGMSQAEWLEERNAKRRAQREEQDAEQAHGAETARVA